jgi:alpha-beta hydrolase superfamily lysophospholipase
MADEVNIKFPEPLTVIFAHGKESGPWGEKIVALADVARSHGYAVESPDFRGMDDPEERVKHMLRVASEMQGPFILVGSSMGGYVALRASKKLPTLGLFLMAPAVGLAGYRIPRPAPGCKQVIIIHAWQDEIIPVRDVIDYAERHQAELHLVNSDHRLSGQIPLLTKLFEQFIGRGK